MNKKYTYFDLEQWYETPLGRHIYAAEAEWLSEHLKQCFGYYLLQFGGSHSLKALDPSPIRNHIWCIPAHHNDNHEPTICCHFDALPFASHSIDAFVLPHTLELCSDPKAIIQAASEALVPEGMVLILGFNPVGIFAPLKQWLAWRRDTLPWGLEWQRIGRVRHWLEESGCEIESIKTFLFSFSMSILGNMRRQHLVEALGQSVCPTWGGIYLILARKRMVRLTPLKVKWTKLALMDKEPALPMQNE